MATPIVLTDKDYRGTPYGLKSSVAYYTAVDTAQTIYAGTTVGARAIVLHLSATSPGTSSAGDNHLGFTVDFGSSANDLYIPVVFWKTSETSTAKEATIVVPLNNMDSTGTIAVEVTRGDSRTWTAIEGHAHLIFDNG